MLMADWAAIANSFEGWSLTEIKAFSPRDRKNWLEIAKYIRGKD